MKWIMPFALSLLLVSPAVAADGPKIGYVKSVEGTAKVVRGDAETALEVGSPLFEGDVLVTGEDGALGFTLKDGTTLSTGPDTMMAVDDFAFAPADQKFGLTARVSQGTVDFVSGLLGKTAPETVEIKTPAGVIGIRGTHFALHVKPERRPGTWLKNTTPSTGAATQG